MKSSPEESPESRTPGDPASPIDGRERLLEVAERHFCDLSYHAVSLRKITAEAGVALGLVGHHFGGKRALLEAVFDRLVGSLIEDRVATFAALLEREADVDLEEFFVAFHGPALRFLNHPEGGRRAKFMLRGFFDHDDFWPLVQKHSAKVGSKHIDLLRELLAPLPAEVVMSRLKASSLTISVGLLPTSQNTADPRPPGRDEVERLLHYAYLILADRQPMKPLAFPELEEWGRSFS